jgi:hypothetical protein
MCHILPWTVTVHHALSMPKDEDERIEPGVRDGKSPEIAI